MAGEERTSSVLFERQAENAPMVLSFNTQSVSVIFLTKRSIWSALSVLHLLEQFEIVSDLLGNFDECTQILGKTAPNRCRY